MRWLGSPPAAVPPAGSLVRVLLATVLSASALSMAACQKPRQLDDDTVFAQRAGELVTAWRSTAKDPSYKQGLRPVDALTLAPEQGFPSEATFKAFQQGTYRAERPLPTQVPPPGTVRAPDDGTNRPVPLISASDAFAGMRRTDCEGSTCPTLTVTGATLGTTPLRTNQGRVTVPAWLFAIAELPVPVVRVAIAPGALTPLPTTSLAPLAPNARHRPVLGVTLDRRDQFKAVVRFSLGACDTLPMVKTFETVDTLVVGAFVKPPPAGKVCTQNIVVRDEKVDLGRPIGDRVVLDAISGAPIAFGEFKSP